jgi:hypothetical protein
MTNEETIKSLKKLKSFHNGSYGTAIDLAIKALEQQPCEDCISRDAVKKLKKYRLSYDTNTTIPKSDIFVKISDIKELPSVQPQPNTGEWIKEHHTIKCNNCNTIIFTSCDYNDREEYRNMVMDDYIEQYKYCPECGADMNGGDEE